jgi:ribosomal protein S24E
MKLRNKIYINLLKTHTNIHIDFINLFLSKFEIGHELEFNINEKDVISYLNITQHQLRNRLHNKYRKKYFLVNVDYIICKTGKTSQLVYYLNYDCFEKIAMTSETIMGYRVRDYFVMLRNFVFNNGPLIKQALDNHNTMLKTLENNKYDVLYFFAVDRKYKDIYKVGYTSDLISRIKVYNTGRIDDIHIKYACVVYNGRVIENCISKTLDMNKHIDNREIYNIKQDLLVSAIDKCYKRYTTKNTHEKIYNDMATLLNFYEHLEQNKNHVPFMIIGK